MRFSEKVVTDLNFFIARLTPTNRTELNFLKRELLQGSIFMLYQAGTFDINGIIGSL